MLDFLSGLTSLVGVILLASLVLNLVDKEGKWVGLTTAMTLYSSKLCGIVLALLVINLTASFTHGGLSFSTIGIYAACVSIIWTSAKDLMMSSTLLENMVTVASHKANTLQADLAKKADELAKEAKAQAAAKAEAEAAAKAEANKPKE